MLCFDSLRSEDTKWDQFGFAKCGVCVLILMSYINNSNKKMGSPSSFFRNFELIFRILCHFLYRDIRGNVVFPVQLSQSTLDGALELLKNNKKLTKIDIRIPNRLVLLKVYVTMLVFKI